MRKLTECKINGLSWKVELTPRGSEELKNDDGRDCFGTSHCGAQKIYLDETLPKDLMRQTLFHELAHAYMFSYGYHINDEEAICDFIGSNIEKIYHQGEQIMCG